MKRVGVLMVLMVAAAPGWSRGEGDRGGVPDERMARLARGVNLSGWFEVPPGRPYARLGRGVTRDDLRLIRSLGFRHVRLAIEPRALWDEPAEKLRPEPTAALEEALRAIHDEGLAVVVDIHPSEATKPAIIAAPGAADRYVAFWAALAERLATLDPERTFFEVLNEPVLNDPARWREIQGRVLAAMRKAAPKHTLVACGDRWSGIDRLLLLEPYDDPNVVYTFHTYDPFTFTHQGATWTSPEVRPLRGDLPYPSSPEGVAGPAQALTDPKAKGWAVQYGKDRWNAEKLDGWLGQAAGWARKHHARLYCGEFGVIKKVKPEYRYAWMKDMTAALNHHGIGWALWDYAGGFGIAEGPPGARKPDPETVTALGLTPE